MLFPFLLTFSFNFCYKRYINSLKSLDMSNSQGPLDVEEIVARYVTLGGPESNGRHIKSTPIGIIRDLSVTTPAGLEQGTDLLSNLYSTCFSTEPIKRTYGCHPFYQIGFKTSPPRRLREESCQRRCAPRFQTTYLIIKHFILRLCSYCRYIEA